MCESEKRDGGYIDQCLSECRAIGVLEKVNEGDRHNDGAGAV